MKNQSLQDQLLNAGLINHAKAKKIRSEKRKQTKKQRHNKVDVVDETKKLVAETKIKQLEKDKQLNAQRHQGAEKKQKVDQIIQLIKDNKLAKDDKEGMAYQFTDQNKVKVIYINEQLRLKIIAGKLAIVKLGTQYEVVDLKVAEQIRQRDEQQIIVLFTESTATVEEEGYQGYEIPDDLIW